MVVRVIAVFTALASLAIVAIVFVPGFPQSVSTWLAAISITIIACGLLAMIYYLNTSAISTEERDRWRRHLWWGGPFVAAAFLWSVAGIPQSSERRIGPLRAVAGPLIAMFLATASTVAAGWVRPEMPNESSLDWVVRYGSQVTGTVLGSLVGSAFSVPVRWIVICLLPSWVLTAWQDRDNALEVALIIPLLLGITLMVSALTRASMLRRQKGVR